MEVEQIVQRKIHKGSKSVILIGILALVLGIVAMVYPAGIGKISTVVFGVFLVIGGSIRILFSYMSVSMGSMFLRYLYALMMVIAGIWIIMNPEMGLESLTLILAIYFIIDGITAVVYSFSLMPIGGGIFMLLSGIISGALGIMILTKWPESSEYVLGIYIGVKIFIDGMMLALTGYAVRKSTKISS